MTDDLTEAEAHGYRRGLEEAEQVMLRFVREAMENDEQVSQAPRGYWYAVRIELENARARIRALIKEPEHE